MLKIETDYNADKANCLLNILNLGTLSTCVYCDRYGVVDCPYDDIQKAKKQICEFINECNFRKNVERYCEHDANILLDVNKTIKETEDNK